ncbi:hypothetical protein KIPB_006291 [Kipferlia bialata]|uniref:Uncharacterized protein n=1 Tax=Kipferlia bialata TaxID=797122 RepID=A0A391NMA4_9EUKA|nr:hypothetical protein KIPB_006291 [Kipferlia bialata]|eukprot:g6291.t1
MPTDESIYDYIEEFEQQRVSIVVRLCNPVFYHTEPFSDRGMHVEDLHFESGGVPPPDIVERWRYLVRSGHSLRKISTPASYQHSLTLEDPLHDPGHSGRRSVEHQRQRDWNSTGIAVHGISGVRRAPVLIAVSLIDAGVPARAAISRIASILNQGSRKTHREVFTGAQRAFLETYTPHPYPKPRRRGLLGMLTGCMGHRETASDTESLLGH